jgi:hypothetical protein
MNITRRQLLKETMMKQNSRFCGATLVGALLTLGLMFTAAVSAADQNPCSEDIAKFCKDVKPDRRAILDCLERHESQLSDACKDYEAKMENPRVESSEVVLQQMRVRQACRSDLAKFCNEVKPGSVGITTCLKENASELSQPCKDAVEAARGGSEEKRVK